MISKSFQSFNNLRYRLCKVIPLIYCILIAMQFTTDVSSYSVRYAQQNILRKATRNLTEVERFVPRGIADIPYETDDNDVQNQEKIPLSISSSDDLSSPNVHSIFDEIKAEEELRELLCPSDTTNGRILHNDTEAHPLRYDLRHGVCAQVGFQEHCGDNMIFIPEIDSYIYGYCECDFEKDWTPLVYHSETNSCYHIYEKAYCVEGEWLILSKEARKPLCVPSKCSKEDHFQGNSTRNESRQYVPLNGNGECVQLNAPNEICEDPNQIVLFQPYHLERSCAEPVDKDEEALLRSMTIGNHPCPVVEA